eukprot:m.431517 g.431517  ORF g.431517 m.431517 type:complete len:80 (+) comp84690_c0_seq1:71-310(+)
MRMTIDCHSATISKIHKRDHKQKAPHTHSNDADNNFGEDNEETGSVVTAPCSSWRVHHWQARYSRPRNSGRQRKDARAR